MSFFLNSGFEVIHPSADQLVVLAHPAYWLLPLTILLAAIGISFGLQGLRKRSNSSVGLGLFLIILGVFLSSIALAQGRAAFDKGKGTVTFDCVGILFRSRHLSFPLRDVLHATVHGMGGGSYHFIVVFKDGGVEDLLGSTGATGQYRAADAVNEFLGAAR